MRPGKSVAQLGLIATAGSLRAKPEMWWLGTSPGWLAEPYGAAGAVNWLADRRGECVHSSLSPFSAVAFVEKETSARHGRPRHFVVANHCPRSWRQRRLLLGGLDDANRSRNPLRLRRGPSPASPRPDGAFRRSPWSGREGTRSCAPLDRRCGGAPEVLVRGVLRRPASAISSKENDATAPKRWLDVLGRCPNSPRRRLGAARRRKGRGHQGLRKLSLVLVRQQVLGAGRCSPTTVMGPGG